MTRRQLVKLTEGWARALGLGDWRIEVAFGQVDAPPLGRVDTALAEADYNSVARWARITYDLDTLGRGEEDVTAIVVHELLHLMLVPLTSVAEELHGHGGAAAKVYRDALLLAEEVVVDRMAHAIVSP